MTGIQIRRPSRFEHEYESANERHCHRQLRESSARVLGERHAASDDARWLVEQVGDLEHHEQPENDRTATRTIRCSVKPSTPERRETSGAPGKLRILLTSTQRAGAQCEGEEKEEEHHARRDRPLWKQVTYAIDQPGESRVRVAQQHDEDDDDGDGDEQSARESCAGRGDRLQWDLRGKAPVATPRPGGRGAPGGGGGGFGGNPQGALVDPGEYTAKLVVDGQTLTTAVVVEPDPMVTTTTEDRTQRRQVIAAGLALQAKTEPASVKAESASDQLDALRKSVDGFAPAPAAVKTAAKSAAEEAAKLKTELARVNRSTTQLFGQISGSPFLPTTTQRQELEDLTKEFDEQSAALNTLLTTTVPALDKQLHDAGVPRIIVK